MFTLFNCLYDLLSHILEEHANQVPAELYIPLNAAANALETWLEKNKSSVG